MSKLAAIYIRTSSEHQAEKASPEEQERDCRELAEQQGLNIVSVYRDIERYRVGGRMVDPSGTRRDRPGLVAMLKGAAAGQFDTIIAWREDRLYRGLRAMLDVLDTVQEHKLTILIVCETFDPRMAPLKAWLASMELEGMRERMTMGVKARLRAGKANTGQDRYGYKRIGEKIVVVEEEAHWVRMIFMWYIARIPASEIRRRLIEAGAPQKGSSRPRRIEWSRPVIQSIIQAGYEYAHGVKIQRRAGEAFIIPVEPIISLETYEQAQMIRQGNKAYRSRNVKRDYLLGGLIRCDCGRCWGARATRWRDKAKKRIKATAVYYCTQEHKEVQHPDCPRTIGQLIAEDTVWSKVLEVLNAPDALIAGARLHVEDIQRRTADIQAQQQQLQEQLDSLTIERQWVITQARKRAITEDDMEYQLGVLAGQEVYLKRELTEFGLVQDFAKFGDWETHIRAFLAEVRKGLAVLERTAKSEEEQHEQFLFKRQIVLNLVERVQIKKGREIKTVFKLDVPGLLSSTSKQALNVPTDFQIWSAETYTHTQSSLPVHPSAVCA